MTKHYWPSRKRNKMKHKHIIATRTFIYDVEEIRKELNEMNDEDATDEDIWEMINDWISEDMSGSSYAYNDITLTDQDGKIIKGMKT